MKFASSSFFLSDPTLTGLIFDKMFLDLIHSLSLRCSIYNIILSTSFQKNYRLNTLLSLLGSIYKIVFSPYSLTKCS